MNVPQLVLLCVSLFSQSLIFDAYAAEDNGLTLGPTTPTHAQASSPVGDWRQKAQRPAVAPSAGMLFESKSWAPAPERSKAEPQLPSFPYHYMGRVQLGGRPDTVYLTKGDRIYPAVVGALIEGTYRVVEIGSDRLEVIYLPLARKQQITLSAIVQPPPPQATSPHVNTSSAPAVTASRVQPSGIDAERNAQGAITGARAAGVRTDVSGAQPSGSAGVAPSESGISGSAVRSPGYGPGPIVISPPIAGTSSTASTTTPMATTAPTVHAMPVAPPSAGAMIVSPPTTTTMPILPPAQGR